MSVSSTDRLLEARDADIVLGKTQLLGGRWMSMKGVVGLCSGALLSWDVSTVRPAIQRGAAVTTLVGGPPPGGVPHDAVTTPTPPVACFAGIFLRASFWGSGLSLPGLESNATNLNFGPNGSPPVGPWGPT